MLSDAELDALQERLTADAVDRMDRHHAMYRMDTALALLVQAREANALRQRVEDLERERIRMLYQIAFTATRLREKAYPSVDYFWERIERGAMEFFPLGDLEAPFKTAAARAALKEAK
jgi:hypothetical protein